MPCNSDYMEPNFREQELQNTAQLLVYVRMNTNSGVKVTEKLRNAANNIYCRDDFVPELCAAIRELTEEQEDKLIYDGRNPQARKLADWWEKHQAADKLREQREAAEARKQALRQSGIAKLTEEEKQALGIK